MVVMMPPKTSYLLCMILIYGLFSLYTVQGSINGVYQLYDYLNATTPQSYKFLIILYGQFRTLEQTCDSIFSHIVRFNQPADIVISIDGTHFPMPPRLLHDCMDEFYDKIHLITGTFDDERFTFGDIKEFILLKRAFDYVAAQMFEYDYAIKVRTDNFVKVDIDVLTIFCKSSAFYLKYLSYEKQFQAEYWSLYQKPPTHNDVLLAYILTSGIREFNYPVLYYPRNSPYCFINNLFWNKDLVAYISSLPALEKTTYQYHKMQLKTQILDIYSKFPILYLIGNTWIQYGNFSLMREVNELTVKRFGSFRWNVTRNSHGDFDLPEGHTWPLSWIQNRTDIMKKIYEEDQWLHVTESQFRLAHRALKYNLIDLYNHKDEATTFYPEEASLFGEINDPKLIVWLLRDCRKQRWWRLECQKYSQLNHPSNFGG